MEDNIDYLKQAEEDQERRKIKPNPDLQIEKSLAVYADWPSQIYGPDIANRIIRDCNLIKTKSNSNEADSYIMSKSQYYCIKLKKIIEEIFPIYFEIKVSYLSRNKKTYSITHIRDFQVAMDFYIICLIDRSDNFRPYFYCIPKSYITESSDFKRTAQDGTPEVNANNKNIPKRITILKEIAYQNFDKYNVLRGTSYTDLIDYVNYMRYVTETSENMTNDNSKTNMFVNSIVNSTSITYQGRQVIHQSAKRFALEVNGVLIKGETNKETIIKFVNNIGSYSAKDFFSKSWLSNTPNQWRDVKINLSNDYLNPRLSYRDIQIALRRGAKRSNLNVKLIDLD